MDGAAELFSAVEAALNDREIAAYEDFTNAVREVLALARQAEALQRENAELREALKPFAEEAGCYDPDTGDSDDVVWDTSVYFKIRDLRRAHTLIQGEKK